MKNKAIIQYNQEKKQNISLIQYAAQHPQAPPLPPPLTPPAQSSQVIPPANQGVACHASFKAAQKENMQPDNNDSKKSNNTIPTNYLTGYDNDISLPTSHVLAYANKVSTAVTHSNEVIFILNSAATKDMMGYLPLFIHIVYFPESYNGVVVLGDGKTRLKVKGFGTIQMWMKNEVFRLKNVLYVPELDDTLFSMILHGTHPNCFFVIKEGKVTLGFCALPSKSV
eukprot:6421004-Ditylum_brightwellii.AAC.1